MKGFNVLLLSKVGLISMGIILLFYGLFAFFYADENMSRKKMALFVENSWKFFYLVRSISVSELWEK